MATPEHNRAQMHSAARITTPPVRAVHPPLQSPDTERSLTHSPFFHGPLYERMSEDLHLGGMSKRTHEGYLRAVRQQADFCKLSPDQISEDQLRKFFLHLKNDKAFASGSLRVAFSGIKFFYTRGVGNGVGTQLPKRPEGCSAQLSPDPVSKERWLATPDNFLFPEAVASPIYRQKFREALREAGLENSVDPSVWHKWWEVNVKPVSGSSGWCGCFSAGRTGWPAVSHRVRN